MIFFIYTIYNNLMKPKILQNHLEIHDGYFDDNSFFRFTKLILN